MIEDITRSKTLTLDAAALLQALGLVHFAITQPSLTCRKAFGRVTNVTQQKHLIDMRERYSRPTEVVAMLWHIARLPESDDTPIGDLYRSIID